MKKQNKEKKNTVFKAILIAVFLVMGIVASTAAVSAYRGDYTTEGPNFDIERHADMEEAFDALSYESWYMLMSQNERKGHVLDVVSEENFEDFVEAHNAGLNGEYDKAAEIRAELGLGNGQGNHGLNKGQGNGQGMHKGQGQGMHQQNYGTNFIDSDNDGNCDNLMY